MDGLGNGDTDGLLSGILEDDSLGALEKRMLNSSRSIVPSPFLSSSSNNASGSLFTTDSDGEDVLGKVVCDRQ